MLSYAIIMETRYYSFNLVNIRRKVTQYMCGIIVGELNNVAYSKEVKGNHLSANWNLKNDFFFFFFCRHDAGRTSNKPKSNGGQMMMM